MPNIEIDAVSHEARLALVKIADDIERLKNDLASGVRMLTGIENVATFALRVAAKIDGLEAAARLIHDAERELHEKKDKPTDGDGGANQTTNEGRGPY